MAKGIFAAKQGCEWQRGVCIAKGACVACMAKGRLGMCGRRGGHCSRLYASY